MGRLEIIGAILLLAGLFLCGRTGWRLMKAIRARSTYGAPYKQGMIMDRFLGFLMSAPILLAGTVVGFLSLAQASLQPDEELIRVGRIEARRAGWGRTNVIFRPAADYPVRHSLEGEISGSRWAVAGDFVVWDRSVKWLGLRSGHRMRYLLGTLDPSGLSKDDGRGTVELEALPTAAALLVAAAKYIPFVEVRLQASQWIRPADLQVIDVHAGPHGYVADIAATHRAR